VKSPPRSGTSVPHLFPNQSEATPKFRRTDAKIGILQDSPPTETGSDAVLMTVHTATTRRLHMSEPQIAPDSAKEPSPSTEAEERIKSNASRASELQAEREKEKKARSTA
jgi:hypothetical protein